MGKQHTRRGRKPFVKDGELLKLIREDLKRSSFRTEGHRKTWARLRYRLGLPVACKRVLRIMRDNGLLRHERPNQERRIVEDKALHRGHIVTSAPNIMWATDSIEIRTEGESTMRLFVVVEHWNSECLAWSLIPQATLPGALQPIRSAIQKTFGGLREGIAQGLSLRLDHWKVYLTREFLEPLYFWGVTPHFTFPMQPQTNGVVERFQRTLEEEVLYGQFSLSPVELAKLVRWFICAYNRRWLLRRLGYRSPWEARRQCL